MGHQSTGAFGGSSGIDLRSSLRSTVVRNNDDRDDRPLQSSQATLSLHDSGVSVVYKDRNGRVSRVADQDFTSAVRQSVLGGSSGPRASTQNEEPIDYSYSTNLDAYYSAQRFSDEDISGLRAELESLGTEPSDTTLVRRSTIRSSHRESVDELITARESRLSTLEQVKNRNSDPSLRKRPTSAGATRNKSYIHDDISSLVDQESRLLTSLSDTEVDRMEINVEVE